MSSGTWIERFGIPAQPRAKSITDSGIGTTAMEEDVKSNAVREDVESNAVREESVEDETSCAILDHSSGPDDLTWDAEIPYLKITDDSTTVCKTPVMLSTPGVTTAVDAVLSAPESPGNKKQCWQTMAERLLKSTEIGELDYKDTPLVGYTRPDLSRVIPWICFEAQSMMEPPWQTELAKIKQDDDVQYITAMFVWFQHWRIRSGSWPSLPRCDFAPDQETIDTVNLCLAPTLAKMDLSLGELQALKVLTTLQCLAELGPQKPVQGTISHCVKLIMRQLMVLDIYFLIPSSPGLHCFDMVEKHLIGDGGVSC